ncbi:MAG: S8 family serine peptidase, partial [Marinicella sp.]
GSTADTFEVSQITSNKDIQTNDISTKRTLKLNAAEFDPLIEKLSLSGLPDLMQQSSKYGLVQFHQKDSKSYDRIHQMGAKVLNYLPHDTYVVEWDEKTKAKLQKSDTFRFVGDYQPVYKLSPHVWNSAKALKTEHSHMEIELFGFKGSSRKNLKNSLQKYAQDVHIDVVEDRNGMPYVKATIKSDVVSTLLQLVQAQDVMWIDRYLQPKVYNIDSVGPIQSNQADITQATIWNKGITGTGQIVAVADSGLDRNQDFFTQYNTGSGGVTKKYTNATYPGASTVGELNLDHKVIGYFVQPGASEYDDDAECSEDSGATGFHGTHVTGTVAGDSGTPASSTSANYDEGDGMAPHAQILFQDLGNTQSGCLSGRGGYDMFIQAAGAGAGISSNSYGTNAVEDDDDDGYFPNDLEVDQASYDIEDMLIVFAAGNDGFTGLGHPGHAKNGLTVGAVGHGISETTAGFSSRGPAYDGRRKPDIVAPGVGIMSAGGNLDNAVPPAQPSGFIESKSGTSMATPTVSGGLALMRQYFMDGFYPSGSRNAANAIKPTGSLLKSTVLNGTYMRTRTPSVDQGWGRIWLDNNLYFTGDSKGLRVWDLPNSNGLVTDDEMTFKVQVPSGEDFRATLSWFDPPAALGNGQALINDLDLEVKFNGQTYKGNNWSMGESLSGGNADSLNNVEQIHLPNPSAGEYEIIVKGTQINGSGEARTRKQGFALVTSQAQCSTSVSASASIDVTDSASGDPMINLTPASGINDYQLYRKAGTCAADNSGYQFIG